MMGVNNSALLSPLSNYMGRKRPASSDFDQNSTPCKKFCPEKTIYEQCFVKGVGHDIVVKILDREWKLHKDSLIKSPYFASMFSGSWNESHKREIEIQIPNPRITPQAIHIVLGSLYQPNISFDHKDILSVIAAATLFQLDELVTRCEEILIRNISCENVLLYYDVAKQYSLNKVLKSALSFLQINLVLLYPSIPEHLRAIDSDLMQLLISASQLVTTSAFNTYCTLRLWLYLRCLPQSVRLDKINSDDLAQSARRFFLDQPKCQCYLLTSQGAPYSRVFQSLELFPLISSRATIVEIQEDNIIPQAWLTNVYEIVVPIVARIMHPKTTERDQGAAESVFSPSADLALDIEEPHLSRNCIKWCKVLSKEEICTPRNRSSWLTWTLHSFGLVTDWKFSGSSLKVMFTPSPLFEGNLLGEDDIKYVPLYCRFSIYSLGSCNQQLQCVSKTATTLLEKFRHEDLFSFRREDFGDDSVCKYMLSLQVFVVHRVLLYKMIEEKLCDDPRLRQSSDSVIQPSHSPINSADVEASADSDSDASYSTDSDVDVEGEDSFSDSSDSEDPVSSRSSDAESDRVEPESREASASSPTVESSCLWVSGSMSSQDKWAEGRSSGDVRDRPHQESVVRIVLPRNIHTDTVY